MLTTWLVGVPGPIILPVFKVTVYEPAFAKVIVGF
jgi:hypothetical protein